MPTTALLILCGGAVSGVLPVLLLAAAARSAAVVGGLLVLLAFLWIYATQVFVSGAVASIAAADARPSLSAAVGATLSRYGGYLGASAVLLGGALVALVAMVGMAQLGRIGGAGTVLLALLTPVLALVGSAVVLLVPNAHQLAFAAVAVDDAGPVDAVRFAFSVVRDRRGELLLWIAGSSALLLGLLVGVVAPIVAGFSMGNATLLAALLEDDSSSRLGVTAADSVAAGIVAAALGGLFLWTVLGLWSSFATASAVHFRRALAGVAVVAAAGAFCDSCGTRLTVGARFCDGCGAQARSS
jgi:hypothetical protein